MRFIDKFIQWIVAFNIIFISVIDVFESAVKIFSPALSSILVVARLFFLLLMLMFQLQNFGLRLYNKLFGLFLIVYNIYVLLYLTELRVYPIEMLASVPTSLVIFFYRLFTMVGYLLCAKTVVCFLNIRKLLILSFFFTILPSIWYILFVGVRTIQLLEVLGDDKISLLALGYTNATILVLAIFSFNKLYKQKLSNIIISIVCICLTSYIILICTRRGPILWSMVNVALCLYFTSKSVSKYIVVFLLIGSIFILNIDFVIDSIRNVAPKTAERITKTIKDKDTSGRTDETGTYMLGLRTFETSPIWGSYFRIVNHNTARFRGAYPHNIFIEILMTMGIIGFIPFLYLMLKAFGNARRTFRRRYSDSQLACLILFLAPFLQLQTTNSIVASMSFWVFFYVMCIMNNFSLDNHGLKTNN